MKRAVAYKLVLNIRKLVKKQTARRLVDINELGANLICKQCKVILRLLDTTNETRQGLHSVLHITCRSCGKINKVTLGTMHRVDGKHTITDFNTKIALGNVFA